MNAILLRDKEVASLIGMSTSWVRVQRHKRKTGQDHVFTIDSIFIGRAARYRKDQVLVWLDLISARGGMRNAE